MPLLLIKSNQRGAFSLILSTVHKASREVSDIVFALADPRSYFQYRRDERLPRPGTSWGRINTHLMGNMCVGDETASLI